MRIWIFVLFLLCTAPMFLSSSAEERSFHEQEEQEELYSSSASTSSTVEQVAENEYENDNNNNNINNINNVQDSDAVYSKDADDDADQPEYRDIAKLDTESAETVHTSENTDQDEQDEQDEQDQKQQQQEYKPELEDYSYELEDPSTAKKKKKSKSSNNDYADPFPRNPDGTLPMPKMSPKELEELLELAAYLPQIPDIDPTVKKKKRSKLVVESTEEEDIAQHLANEKFKCSHCNYCVKLSQDLFQQKKTEEMILKKLLATCSDDTMENNDRVLCNRMIGKYGEDIIAALSVGEEPDSICNELGICTDTTRQIAQAKLIREERNRVTDLKAKYESFMTPEELSRKKKANPFSSAKASKGLKSAKGKAKRKMRSSKKTSSTSSPLSSSDSVDKVNDEL